MAGTAKAKVGGATARAPRKSAAVARAKARRTAKVADTPLISICLPTYKRTKFLHGCIASCLAQTAHNFELIIHDDTQDDSIKSIVESFGSDKIRYIQNKPGLGLIRKLNDFMDQVRSDWMVYLCDDDLLEPGYIAATTRHIADYPAAALIRCRHRLIDINGDDLRLDGKSPLRSTNYEFLAQLFRPDLQSFRTNVSAVAFNKATLRRVGGIRETGRSWHTDRLAWAEMGALGDTICDPEPLARLRLHGESLSSGLDAEYQGAIDATLALKPYLANVYAKMRDDAKTPDQLVLVAESENGFEGYIERSLRRAVDQGLLAAIAEPGRNARADVRAAETVLRAHGIRPFRSFHIYRMASYLPPVLRASFMKRFQRRKLDKLAVS